MDTVFYSELLNWRRLGNGGCKARKKPAIRDIAGCGGFGEF